MSRRNSRGGNRGGSRGGRGGRGGNVRTDRIGSTLREIIADELARIDDDSVAYVTVTEVEVDNELTKARVFLSSLDLAEEDVDGVREHEGRIKKAIARRARIRRVPDLEFMVDPGLIAGTRVNDILMGLENERVLAADSEDEEE